MPELGNAELAKLAELRGSNSGTMGRHRPGPAAAQHRAGSEVAVRAGNTLGKRAGVGGAMGQRLDDVGKLGCCVVHGTLPG